MKKLHMLNKLHVLTTSALVSSVLLTSHSASAAGFQIEAQSATGAGRAYAGDGIIADNAAVMSINPAAMALFDKTEFTMGALAIKPKIGVSDGYYESSINDNTGPVSYSDAGNLAVAPNIFLIVPINEKFALGAGMYSNFGTESSFDSSFPNEYGGESSIMSAEIALAASYRLNEQWSFGAGLDLIYGIGKFKRGLDVNIPFSGEATKNVADVDAGGFGVGWNIGTTFELDKNNRWGISYHNSPKITATGDLDGAALSGADELYVNLPDFAQFSGYNRIPGTRAAISYTLSWTNWSQFDQLTTNGNINTLENFQWRDTWSFAIGETYYLTDKWTIRGGYKFDQGAQDEITTIAVPDSNRHWLSAGFSYAPTPDSSIDFGFTYLLGVDVDTEQEYPISSINAVTHTDAIITGLQYSKSF